MPTDHPLAAKDVIAPDELDEHNVLLLGEGHCFRDQVLAACPHLQSSADDATGRRRTAGEGSSLETLRHMVASGLGITVLPLSEAMNTGYSYDFLVTRTFAPPAPRRNIALVCIASLLWIQAI